MPGYSISEHRVHANSESMPASTHTPSQAETLCPKLLPKSRHLGWVTHEAKTKRSDCTGRGALRHSIIPIQGSKGKRRLNGAGGMGVGSETAKASGEMHGPVGKRNPHCEQPILTLGEDLPQRFHFLSSQKTIPSFVEL